MRLLHRGMVMTAQGLLNRNPSPSEKEVRATLAGNLCRCGSHNRIVKAVLRAARGHPRNERPRSVRDIARRAFVKGTGVLIAFSLLPAVAAEQPSAAGREARLQEA